MNTATDDGLIRRNPCRIKGASSEKSPERPVLTIREVLASPKRWHRGTGPSYCCSFGSLRWGELAGLQRNEVDLDAPTIRIVRQLAEQRGGGFAVLPRKSDAGKRAVVIPRADRAHHAAAHGDLCRTQRRQSGIY